MENYNEYNRDSNPYPSYGKKYEGEKSIISLTSWKARINTVYKTLFSLIDKCPGFHIVLVLSEEEFPKMCEELPENLMLFVENEMIELLWVYKNYKSFKKVLFTMDKYRSVPVISADDDCMYIENYAEKLYNKWNEHKGLGAIRLEKGRFKQMQGPSSLYYIGDLIEKILPSLNEDIIKKSEDDVVLYNIMKQLGISVNFVYRCIHKPYVFHDTIKPLHSNSSFLNMPEFRHCFRR